MPTHNDLDSIVSRVGEVLFTSPEILAPSLGSENAAAVHRKNAALEFDDEDVEMPDDTDTFD